MTKSLACSRPLGYPYGNIVRLLLLTGQRHQEIVRLRWDEIDWKAATLTIPAERNKSGRQHTLPLTPMALEALEAFPRLHNNAFPARGRPERTFSGSSKCKRQFDEACGVTDWTLHDLRMGAVPGPTLSSAS